MEFQSLWQRIQTPRKRDELVLAPSCRAGDFDSHLVDCAFPFRHGARFYMTYVGWDSVGYRTGLAVSDDLVHWEKLGLILDRGPKGSVTEFNAALTSILRDNALFGCGELKRINGRFVGTYHAYPAAGYEAGPACIGLCFSDDLRHWHIDAPALRADDPDAGDWERGGLYKSWIMEHAGQYFLFYNAKNQTSTPDRWIEQTGFATSTDLRRWKRHPQNPVLPVGSDGAFDDLFSSDPVVLQAGDAWVMFYFGNCSDGHAREGVAFSTDLFHWEKSPQPLIEVGVPGAVDSTHAHKPGIITHGDRLYHFYCAVRPLLPGEKKGNIAPGEGRGIALATT